VHLHVKPYCHINTQGGDGTGVVCDFDLCLYCLEQKLAAVKGSNEEKEEKRLAALEFASRTGVGMEGIVSSPSSSSSSSRQQRQRQSQRQRRPHPAPGTRAHMVAVVRGHVACMRRVIEEEKEEEFAEAERAAEKTALDQGETLRTVRQQEYWLIWSDEGWE
jgi:hypothetical protein